MGDGQPKVKNGNVKRVPSLAGAREQTLARSTVASTFARMHALALARGIGTDYPAFRERVLSRQLDHPPAPHRAGRRTHPMRSENRFYFRRAKRRAYEHARLQFPLRHWWFDSTPAEESRRNYVRGAYRNLAQCSCNMCRNPRHSCFYKGAARLTFQERRANLSFAEQVTETAPPKSAYTCGAGGRARLLSSFLTGAESAVVLEIGLSGEADEPK